MDDEQPVSEQPASEHEAIQATEKVVASDTGVTLVEAENGEYMDPQTGDLYDRSGQRLGKQHRSVLP